MCAAEEHARTRRRETPDFSAQRPGVEEVVDKSRRHCVLVPHPPNWSVGMTSCSWIRQPHRLATLSASVRRALRACELISERTLEVPLDRWGVPDCPHPLPPPPADPHLRGDERMPGEGPGAVPRTHLQRTHLHRTCGALRVRCAVRCRPSRPGGPGLRGPNGVGAVEVAPTVDGTQLGRTGITSPAGAFR